MSKINLWNSISLTQTGRVKLLDSGRELFGTVVQHGVNEKTVTVRVSSRHWNHKYKKALYSNKSKQVHDELNYCVTGDRVIIANCLKMSKTKGYYVKSIVKPIPRLYTDKGQKPAEIEQKAEPEVVEEAAEKTKQAKQQIKTTKKDKQIKQSQLGKLNNMKKGKAKQDDAANKKDKKQKKQKQKSPKKDSPAKKAKKSDNLV